MLEKALFYPVRRWPGTAKMRSDPVFWTTLTVRTGLFLFLLLMASLSHAVVVDGLYQADVEVADHSQRQLRNATRQGLEQVFIKVSGSRAVLGNADIRQALAENQTYLQRYQYLRADDGSLRLRIHYDSELLTDVLTSAGANIWTSNRQPVLLWLVADDGRSRAFVTQETHPELVEVLIAELTRRGVPVVFPLHDLEDTVALNLHELWEFDRLSIFRASGRYGVDNILVGRLNSLSGDRWMGDWLYLRDDTAASSSFYGADLDSLGAAGVDFVADQMAARYAIAAGGSVDAIVHVRVDSVTDYLQYRALVEVLENIEIVDAAWPSYLRDQSMILSLRAQASASELDRVIVLDKRLQRIESPPALPEQHPSAQLSYRWNP